MATYYGEIGVGKGVSSDKNVNKLMSRKYSILKWCLILVPVNSGFLLSSVRLTGVWAISPIIPVTLPHCSNPMEWKFKYNFGYLVFEWKSGWRYVVRKYLHRRSKCHKPGHWGCKGSLNTSSGPSQLGRNSRTRLRQPKPQKPSICY